MIATAETNHILKVGRYCRLARGRPRINKHRF